MNHKLRLKSTVPIEIWSFHFENFWSQVNKKFTLYYRLSKSNSPNLWWTSFDTIWKTSFVLHTWLISRKKYSFHLKILSLVSLYRGCVFYSHQNIIWKLGESAQQLSSWLQAPAAPYLEFIFKAKPFSWNNTTTFSMASTLS